MASEGALQRYFKAQCAKYEVLWRKIKFEGRRGCPDTLIAKNGRVILVELKSPTKLGVLSELQKRQIKHLRNAGIDVRVIDDRKGVDDAISEIIKDLPARRD